VLRLSLVGFLARCSLGLFKVAFAGHYYELPGAASKTASGWAIRIFKLWTCHGGILGLKKLCHSLTI